ncbi:MAG: hypothetical protein V4659_13270 [Pseudomonadota bacterium]
MRKMISCVIVVALGALAVPVGASPSGAHAGIVTPADQAAINAKCRLPAGTRTPDSVTFSTGGLRCPDGRVVRDAETRALGSRIEARARAHVAAVMARPGVAVAVEATADKASRDAIRKLRARDR